jgi:hypothetical protein
MAGKVNIVISRYVGGGRGSYFSVLKISGFALRIKIGRPEPSVNRGIKDF